MPNIVRSSDPFEMMSRDFGSLRQAMDRLWEESFGRVPGFGAGALDEGTLPVDISERDGKLYVRASVPGFSPEDIDVQVNEGVLSIKASRSEEQEQQGEHFYRKERRFGSVSRRIALPGVIADADVDAELNNGVLTLTIPLPEQSKPKQISIRSGDNGGQMQVGSGQQAAGQTEGEQAR